MYNKKINKNVQQKCGKKLICYAKFSIIIHKLTYAFIKHFNF